MWGERYLSLDGLEMKMELVVWVLWCRRIVVMGYV